MLELLGVAFPIILAGFIGYALGLLRDASKAKAERKARHQDEILEASAHVLDASATLARSHQELAYVVWEMSVRNDGANAGYRLKLEERRQEAFKEIREATAAAQPHLMKLTILAPSLDKIASAMLDKALRTGTDTEGWTTQAEEHARSTRVFKADVQEHLRIPRSALVRRWRPWIRKPAQWAAKVGRWFGRLFLE